MSTCSIDPHQPVTDGPVGTTQAHAPADAASAPAPAAHTEPAGSEPTAAQRLAVLRDTRSIALVGASDKPERASYFVATYLLSSTTFDVHFVNPVLAEAGKTILGRPVHASLDDVPTPPDLVEVFRKASDAPGIVEDAHRVGARTVWLQLGIRSDTAARRARELGLQFVMDRCVKIEHARFHGGLHLAGFVTGVISSRRQQLDR